MPIIFYQEQDNYIMLPEPPLKAKPAPVLEMEKEEPKAEEKQIDPIDAIVNEIEKNVKEN